MNPQAFKLNDRLGTGEKEYLIQTINDTNGKRILSSLFSDGELLETFEEKVENELQMEELKKLITSTHQEHKKEIEHLVELYHNSHQQDSPVDLDYLGQALFYKRMYLEAEKLFTRVVNINKEFDRGWFHLGQVLFSLKKYTDSCKAFAHAAELKPHFADYRNYLGEAYLAIDSCKRAAIEFDEALKLNIYYGEAYLNRGLTYLLNAIQREDFTMFANQDEMIRTALEKASVLMPEIVDKHFLEGQMLLENGNLEKAFAKFLGCRERRKASQGNDSANFYLKFLLGTKHLNEKIITRRIKFLQKSISDNPHYADLHYELAVAYTLLSRYLHSKSIEEYSKALSINPQFDAAQRNKKLAENEIKGFDVITKAILKG